MFSALIWQPYWQPLRPGEAEMVSPQFVAETLVALERLGAQPTLNIFDGTISLAGRPPPLPAAPGEGWGPLWDYRFP